MFPLVLWMKVGEECLDSLNGWMSRQLGLPSAQRKDCESRVYSRHGGLTRREHVEQPNEWKSARLPKHERPRWRVGVHNEDRPAKEEAQKRPWLTADATEGCDQRQKPKEGQAATRQ